MEIQNKLPAINEITLLAKACREIAGFEEMYRRLERRMHVQKRSDSTKKNYSLHLAQIALYYGCLPTVLAVDQIEDYMQGLILKGTPSDSYFKPKFSIKKC